MPDSPPAVGFGRLVRAKRRQAGLTQDDLAARTGLGQSTLSQYETGDMDPSLANAVIIAVALDINIEDLAAPYRPRRRRRVEQVA